MPERRQDIEFTHKPFPGSPKTDSILTDYINERFFTLTTVLSTMINNIDHYYVRSVEPPRPQEGMIVYADGTFWNPGSGRGFYGYKLVGDKPEWVFIQ